ncbi:protein spaetzle 5-like [Odontomachus brunneus]|nr:protein spaetzle 5-like [Odontomachus brunneus]
MNSKHSKDHETLLSESYDDTDNVENGKVMSYYRVEDKNRKSKAAEDNILFPDEILLARNDDGNTVYQTNLVPTCKNKNFCLNDPYYPNDFINKMLSDNPSLMNYATIDAVETISHRIDVGEDLLCESKVELINPRSAKNIENDWLFIVQSEKSNFTQSIRIEYCGMEDTACQIIGDFSGYKTKCKQKFIYRQLTAISHKGEIVHELFPIPASCCCHLIKDEIS